MTKEEIKERNRNRKEYFKRYRNEHRQHLLEYGKAWYEANKEEMKEYNKAKVKAWQEEHKDEYKAYQKAYQKAHYKSDLNSLGQTKGSIRSKSQRYLKKYGNIIKGYEIHHCCTYTEPYKFIYCPIELHRLIHSYLKAHNIDADSEHYDQIKHLLDDSVVLYGID